MGPTLAKSMADALAGGAAERGASVRNAPAVLRTSPATLDNNVPATLDKISVTFDRTMRDHSWAWCQDTEKTFPDIIGKPSYDRACTTCTITVKLKPGMVY
jgi:hypothetical protein